MPLKRVMMMAVEPVMRALMLKVNQRWRREQKLQVMGSRQGLLRHNSYLANVEFCCISV